MKIIRNNIIPFKGFKAINLFGVLFVRGDAIMSETDIRHEEIHTAQMREMLYIPFYIAYSIEWIVRLCEFGNYNDAYYNISFEREAYDNEDNIDYLETRESFSFLKYIK